MQLNNVTCSFLEHGPDDSTAPAALGTLLPLGHSSVSCSFGLSREAPGEHDPCSLLRSLRSVQKSVSPSSALSAVPVSYTLHFPVDSHVWVCGSHPAWMPGVSGEQTGVLPAAVCAPAPGGAGFEGLGPSLHSEEVVSVLRSGSGNSPNDTGNPGMPASV